MKYIIIAFTMLFSTSVFANSILVVNSGNDAGVFKQILTDVFANVDHEFIQAGNPVIASSYFNKENVVTIWSSEWPSNKTINSPEINNDNIVALMTYETMMCSRSMKSFEEMKGKTVKIATWGTDVVKRFITTLGNQKDINFVIVPFGGSGSTTKGYVAGDADTVFTITTRQKAVEQSAGTKCFAFSANGDLGFRFVDAMITINSVNGTTNKLREIVTNESEKKYWKEKYSGTVTYTYGDFVTIFDEAVVNFTP